MKEMRSLSYQRVLPEEAVELEKVMEYGLKDRILIGVVAGIETNMVLMNEGLEEVSIITTQQFKTFEANLQLVSGAGCDVYCSYNVGHCVAFGRRSPPS